MGSLLISPIVADEVLEGEGGGETVIRTQAGLGNDLQQGQRVLWFLFFLFEGVLGCERGTVVSLRGIEETSGSERWVPFLC